MDQAKEVVALIAPMSHVALVLDEETIYRLVPGEETRQEFKPHMFNLYHDISCTEIKIQDTYPFPRVREELERSIEKTQLLFHIIHTLDVDLTPKTRILFAKETHDLIRNETSLMYVREILLSTKLPEEADPRPEVISALPEPIRLLLQEVVAKWRPTSVTY